jgi:hypothetical protein
LDSPFISKDKYSPSEVGAVLKFVELLNGPVDYFTRAGAEFRLLRIVFISKADSAPLAPGTESCLKGSAPRSLAKRLLEVEMNCRVALHSRTGFGQWHPERRRRLLARAGHEG